MVEVPPFKTYVPFLDELAVVFADMDRAYMEAADDYGLCCTGCTDNCCLTLFYHHTHIERLYLLNGFFQLAVDQQEQIRNLARMVNQQVMIAVAKKKTPRVMCALNEDGKCMLYASRPMICRLHGIPHEFTVPGRKPVFGPGCAEFVRQCGDKGYQVFDRTPFYLSLAGLEQRFKHQFNISDKIKKTVSEFFL